MRLNNRLYLLLLAAVGAGRLLELRISRRHQRALTRRGAQIQPDPEYRWMVVLHGAVLISSAAEATLLRRRPSRVLAAGMAVPFVLANALRWWVIRTMREHWNVHVVDSLRLGVVATGPFRWLRHPNYLALFVELEALPLISGAWVTALLGGLAHAWILRRRIRAEESVLMRSASYRAVMGSKPRFLPRLGRRWST